MASSSKKRGLSKAESETIDHYLQQRKRPCLQPDSKPLPSKVWKPVFLRHMIEHLDKSPGDAEAMWDGLMDRVTAQIRNGWLIGTNRRRLDDRRLIETQLAIFAKRPENKEILGVFDESTRRQLLESLQVNSRQRIRDGLKREKITELRITAAPSTPPLDAEDSRSPSLPIPLTPNPLELCGAKDDTVAGQPMVYTWSSGKKHGTMTDVDRLKIDCNLPASEDNLDFEQYLGCLERRTDFKRHKDSLYWILPPMNRNISGKLSRIVDSTDWSFAITLQLSRGINYVEFEYCPADEAPGINSVPLAITMNEAKRQRLKT